MKAPGHQHMSKRKKSEGKQKKRKKKGRLSKHFSPTREEDSGTTPRGYKSSSPSKSTKPKKHQD